ncbi:MAG: 4-hydroxythreonine-4-phosphate dehydrogenase PdxA [Desulfuromonadales bacterium]|nr:4-hydroxythreonine-4-phosphate dehydrogenase PdxA [Desulfuromonadales bacterium]
MSKPLIITMGDPTGVGPEIIVQAAASGKLAQLSRPIIVAGDLEVLLRAAQVCEVDVQPLAGKDHNADAGRRLLLNGFAISLFSLSALDPKRVIYGQPDAECGRAMAAYINWACERCLAGEAAGMITAPISKLALQAAGEPYPGHTELLADRCGVEKVVMMLAGARLRVCMVTTHCALSEVPQRLSQQEILSTLRITEQDLKRHFGLETPRIAVLALNPHAGEGGMFGDEEERIIAPAIETARAQGLNVSGPHSADTLFHFAAKGDYDAVVCMYHDQGLIPLKLLHFDDGVNVTLGLPIVRTSVDHGTAYDLAGTGKASETSLVAALQMADSMAGKVS